jgi:hypothetical protein
MDCTVDELLAERKAMRSAMTIMRERRREDESSVAILSLSLEYILWAGWLMDCHIYTVQRKEAHDASLRALKPAPSGWVSRVFWVGLCRSRLQPPASRLSSCTPHAPCASVRARSARAAQRTCSSHHKLCGPAAHLSRQERAASPADTTLAAQHASG